MTSRTHTTFVVVVLLLQMWLGRCADKTGERPQLQRLQKLNQFSYGHLRIDGAVGYYETFRATFGGPLVCGRKELVLADPLEACEELHAADVAGKYVVAARGTCTFVTKAKNAVAAGAAGVIVSNTGGGMLRMPMGNENAEDVHVPVVMTNNATGELIRHALNSGATLKASIHPQVEPCLPESMVDKWMALERPFFEEELRAAEHEARSLPHGIDEAELATSCILGAEGTDESGWVECAPAQFGGIIAPSLLLPESVVADPPLACGEIMNDVVGKVTVVYRGQCPMIQKVRKAQQGGATAVIIVNQGGFGALRAAPDSGGNEIYIPVVMISTESWELLSQLPESTRFAVQPRHAPDNVWEDVAGFVELEQSGWPENESERYQWMLDLVLSHHPTLPEGHWQRFDVVKAVAERSGYSEELERAVREVQADIQSSAQRSKQDVTQDVVTAVLAPRMLAKVTHRVLDSDGSQSEVGGANVLCPRFRDHYHFAVPTFKRGSKHATELHMRALLQQQLCLERLLILNGIAIGQTQSYLKAMIGNVDFEQSVRRLLRELKAPDAADVLDAFEEIASWAFTRSSVPPAVTVAEWLAKDSGVAAIGGVGGDSAGSQSGSDIDAVEGTVSEDGEWSV